MTKAAVFIDGGYLNAILKNHFGLPKVDYVKLSDKISQPDQRFRTYYYTCMPYQSKPPTALESSLYASASKFMTMLKFLPRFEVRLGRLKKTVGPGGAVDFEQKGVDVMMSVDMVKLAATNQVDRAVLVTGDSDFVYAVKVAKESINVTLYYFPGTVHYELLQACDDRIEIKPDFFNDVML